MLELWPDGVSVLEFAVGILATLFVIFSIASAIWQPMIMERGWVHAGLLGGGAGIICYAIYLASAGDWTLVALLAILLVSIWGYRRGVKPDHESTKPSDDPIPPHPDS
jgi:cation transporter-like permease